MLPLLAVGCADPVGLNTAQSAAHPSMLLVLSLSPMDAVNWSTGHTSGTYSTTGTITSKGGQLSIPKSDFTITFAAGAVSAPTAVTITSLSGSYVSYDMQPHGINFQAPVTVTQGLRNTAAGSMSIVLSTLKGVYIDNNLSPANDGTIYPTELLKSVTYLVKDLLGNLIPDRQTWQLNHFSRYMLASG